jgi:hypothetical protein
MKNLRKIIRIILEEEVKHRTVSSNYEFQASPYEVSKKINDIKNIGKYLDSNFLYNIENIQVLSTNEREGKLICEIGYPDGTVVLFYKSEKGTGGKAKGQWFPIPGFTKNAFEKNGQIFPEGWFVKGTLSEVSNKYESRVFSYTADYLLANENDIF